jgi:hypothetical protein
MTASNRSPVLKGDFPPGLAAPARRALNGIGIVRMEQLTIHTEAEVMKLHGVGSNAMEKLRHALAARGWSFAPQGQSTTKQ